MEPPKRGYSVLFATLFTRFLFCGKCSSCVALIRPFSIYMISLPGLSGRQWQEILEWVWPPFLWLLFQCTLMLTPPCLVRSILKSEFVSTDPKFWVLKQNYFDHSARQDLLVLQPGLWSWWQWNPAWRAAIELTLVSSSVRQQLMKTTSDNRIHCGDV